MTSMRATTSRTEEAAASVDGQADSLIHGPVPVTTRLVAVHPPVVETSFARGNRGVA